jgi:hypothetical protein
VGGIGRRSRVADPRPHAGSAKTTDEQSTTDPRIVDLRRDALAHRAGDGLDASLASLDPGLDVMSLLDARQRLLCEDRR